MTPTCEWSEAIAGAVFRDTEGRIVLCVLTRPDEEIIAQWEADYPDLPIREGIARCWPKED